MSDAFLPYCRPDIGDDEINEIVDSLRNGWLTTGPKARAFEEAFAAAAGVKHAVALNSCTAALHVGLLAAGVGPGDEVVTPSLTFVAGAQCTLEVGGRPVFCDVDAQTLTATVDTIAAVTTERTKAIIAMPYAGRPQDIQAIIDFATPRGIAVIEDAAHAAGTLDRDQWAGTRSTLAAYSFYATKNLTTAEGGMLLTNDDAIMDRVRILSLHGMDRDAWKRYTAKGSWRYDVREPGFKYNLPDIAASLGLVQLRRLAEMQARRDVIAQRYNEAFEALPGITLQAPTQHEGDRHSWCMYVIRVNEAQAGISRDAMIDALKERNIGTSVHYIPTHHFTGYRTLAAPESLPTTEQICVEIVSLPLYPTMTDSDVERVIDAVRDVVRPPVSLAR